MLKRIILFSALSIIGVNVGTANAHSMYCSPSSIGGIKRPMLSGNSIKSGGMAGYQCTYKWTISIVPEYESGGMWYVDSFSHIRHPYATYYARDTTHNFTSGTYSRSGFSACSLNWRYHVYFSYKGEILTQQTSSKVLRKTC